jgi:hypothetical protein
VHSQPGNESDNASDNERDIAAMNLKDERKLKYDRRLEGHQDWISPAELEAELSQLPDAADKVYAAAQDDAAAASGAEQGVGSAATVESAATDGAPGSPTNLA